MKILFHIDYFSCFGFIAKHYWKNNAVCKATAEGVARGQKNSVAGGINQGIIYLMLVPLCFDGFYFQENK